MPDFSVLLPVYRGDRPEHFLRSLRSVSVEQILQPSQIVVVCDGPVHPDIDAVLRPVSKEGRCEQAGGVPVTVIRIRENRGLGPALNVGLDACLHDIVARADADDVSLPSRFAKQVPTLVSGYDIVGCAIAEFEEDETDTGLIRRMPRTPEEIRAVVSMRDPFNHPSVVYRASGVRAVGGYEDLPHMEDYWLFARMVTSGQQGYNLPDALVRYRVGAGAYRRRGGMGMLRSECILQWRLAQSGAVTKLQFVRNLLVRGGYRVVPTHARRWLYRAIGVRRWFNR